MAQTKAQLLGPVVGDVTIDTNTLSLDAEGNKVGIGTAGATAKLHVFEPTEGDAVVQFNSGDNFPTVNRGLVIKSATGPTGYTGSKWIFDAQSSGGRIEFQTASSPRLTILESGNVGIGLINPGVIESWTPGGTYLHVGGTTASGVIMKSNYPRLVWNEIDQGANSAIFQINMSGGDAQFQHINDDGSIKAERLRITSTGNIGIKNTSPNNTLTVGDGVQTSYAPSTAGNYIEIARTSGADAGLLINKNTGQWLVGIDNSDGANAPLRFEYAAAGSAHPGFGAGTLGMIIKHDGKVGIGDNDPSDALTVYRSNVGNPTGITIRNTEASSTYSHARLRLESQNGAAYGHIWADVANSALRLAYNSSSSVYIKSDGKIGIGLSNPDAKLQVNGNAVIGTDNVGLVEFTSTGVPYFAVAADASNYRSTRINVVSGGGYADLSFDTMGTAAKTGLPSAGSLVGTIMYLDASTRNVGIGTDNPFQPITIKRESAGQGEFGVRLEYGNTNGPTLTNSAILVGSYGLKFKNYNSGRNFIFETGKVDVLGGYIARNPSDSFTLNGVNQPHYGFQLNSSSSIPIGMSGYYGIAFATNSVERLRITSGGFVQIGDGSYNAEAPLHVISQNSQGINAIFGAKDFVVNNNYNYPDANIALQGRDIGNNDTGAGIQFTVRNTSNTNWWHGAITMDQSGNYIFKNGGAGNAVGTESLRIDSSGRLGINDGSRLASDANEGAQLRVTGVPITRNQYYSPAGNYYGSFGYTDNTYAKSWIAVDSSYAKNQAVSAGIFLSAFHQDAGGSGCGFTIKNLRNSNPLVISSVVTAASVSNPAVETERLRIASTGQINVNQANNNNLQGQVTIFEGTDFNSASMGGRDNIYLISDRTSGNGRFGASIGWSRIGYADRRAAAIVNVQTSSDEDQVGLAFFTHPGSNPTDAVQEKLRITHDGAFVMNAVTNIYQSFVLVNNTTYNWDFTVSSEGGYGNSFYLVAGYNHYYTATYGAHRTCWFSSRGTNVNSMGNGIEQYSGNAGSWTFSKPNATTVRITKTGGTYGGAGYGFFHLMYNRF